MSYFYDYDADEASIKVRFPKAEKLAKSIQTTDAASGGDTTYREPNKATPLATVTVTLTASAYHFIEEALAVEAERLVGIYEDKYDPAKVGADESQKAFNELIVLFTEISDLGASAAVAVDNLAVAEPGTTLVVRSVPKNGGSGAEGIEELLAALFPDAEIEHVKLDDGDINLDGYNSDTNEFEPVAEDGAVVGGFDLDLDLDPAVEAGEPEETTTSSD